MPEHRIHSPTHQPATLKFRAEPVTQRGLPVRPGDLVQANHAHQFSMLENSGIETLIAGKFLERSLPKSQRVLETARAIDPGQEFTQMRSVPVDQREHLCRMPSLEQFQFRAITKIVFEHAR